MQERYRMFRRSGGNFYTRDKITGLSESLGTAGRTQAKQLLAARNQAVAQPQLNRTMARAYLSAKSPDLLTRTWADVMEHYSLSGVETTRHRKTVAFRSRPFATLRSITLMDTEVGHPRSGSSPARVQKVMKSHAIVTLPSFFCHNWIAAS